MLKHYAKKISALAALVLLSLVSISDVLAQTPLAAYSFTGATGSEDSLAVDAQPANAKFSKTGRAGTGVIGTNAANVYNSTGFSMATTVDLTTYISFSATPFTGYKLDLTSMELFVQRSTTGPKSVEIRSSANNYATVLKTIDLTTATNATETVTLPASHTNRTARTEFRIYPFNAGATTGTFRVDNIKVYGAVNTVGPAPTNPVLAFASATAAVAENVTGGTTTVAVNITNPSATAATTVQVALATTGTATAGTDFTFTSPTTLTWAAGDNTPKTVTITIIDDTALEPNETIILNLTNPSTGATLGTSTFTLTINDNEVAPIPTVTVASITVNDPVNFLPTQLGQKVKIVGVLHGVNQRNAGAGLQLTLIDNTGGVGIFTTNNAILPTTVPVEGDRVRAIGTVAHFNGLTQLTLDSIKVLATGQALTTPVVVNGPLTEAHESEMITLANPVTLVNPSQWVNTGTGFTAQVTDGVNTYDMRVVATSNIWGTPAPTGQFVLTGIGGQFDSSDPRDSGYQITPRRLTDLRDVTGVSENLSNAIAIYPNPVANVLNLNLGTIAGQNASVLVVNALGQVVKTVPAATQINVANLPAGVYTLKIAAANGTAVKRFVKVN